MSRGLRGNRGTILVGILALLVIIAISVPLIVRLMNQEAKSSVQQRKSSRVLSLAESAVDRGFWKIKNSPLNFTQFAASLPIGGYNFDTVYQDVSGGTYRIKIATGPGARELTITGEARDVSQGESRAIQGVFRSQPVPAALLSAGALTLSDNQDVFWGPIMSPWNIQLNGAAANLYHPRKLAGQVVSPRDANGINPPNTDNKEWWSDRSVTLPVLDFVSFNSSATASPNTYFTCGTGGGRCVRNNLSDTSGDVWYFDGDLLLTGTVGLRGTLIVTGNLNIESATPGLSLGSVAVPVNAWEDHRLITSAQHDSASAGEYPADNGLNSNAATYSLGSAMFQGFAYVGGDAYFGSPCTIYGALWVGGTWTATADSRIYFDENLDVAASNILLSRRSWREVSATQGPWN